MSNSVQSYQHLIATCQALDTFAEARTQPSPDKNVILALKEVDGQTILQAVKKSDISDDGNSNGRGKDWNASLWAVARYMETEEPYLPKYSCLPENSNIARRYDQDAIDKFKQIDKGSWRNLQLQKARGYEVFKDCLVEHNNRTKTGEVYALFQEHEKKSYLYWSVSSMGIGYKTPNPMGFYPSVDEKFVHLRYKAPIIEPDGFLYLDSFFRDSLDSEKVLAFFEDDSALVSEEVLGFSYEYGLGAKKDIEKAKVHYQKAAEKGEFSAWFNLGRLGLESNPFEALIFLKKAATILEDKIKNAERSIQEKTADTIEKEMREELEDAKKKYETDIEKLENKEQKTDYQRMDLEQKKSHLASLKVFVITPERINFEQKEHQRFCNRSIEKWNKALQKIYPVLEEANKRAEKS